MMSSSEANYRSLSDELPSHSINHGIENTNDNDDTPRNSGLMIHIVPETNKARWNHIEDLDSFFTRMYNYHQKHGFVIIVLDEFFQLCEIAFVVWLLTFTVHCIQYPVLFGNIPKADHTKVTIGDVIIPTGKCVENFGASTFFFLFIATFYFMIRLIKMIYHVTQYSDIKKFYNTALHIDDNELDNITWHEVKKKIREVQAEQQMCIDKEQLTELDIYHRILRFKNYMVALMNKNLLPVRFQLPIIGEVVTLSRGLMYNIDIILFRGPGSPFQNNWQLRDDYTVRTNQVEVAQRLSNLIMWIAIANLVLAPAIFIWQIIYFSFAYANILRKEPGTLGMRTWSNYGRLYLRHFNELDHELDARLNRAYEYADRYLSSFSSPLMAVISKNILFISGGLLLLILVLGIYDEFVFQVEHVLTIITALSVIGLICRTLIPDENLIWVPEQLMTRVLAHVHYLPTEWKNKAHTTFVRSEFGNFFQFKAGYMLNEICSPLVTPFILLFVFRPKALEIVKFFRSFTVTVRGVGNVCSFAQMDVRKHGNPDWQLQNSAIGDLLEVNSNDESKRQNIVEGGKTELSLIRFTLTNPEWQMPPEAKNYINGIRENALQELIEARKPANDNAPNAITKGLVSFASIGDEYSSLAASVFQAHNIPFGMHRSNIQCFASKSQKNAQDIVDETHTTQDNEFEQMLQRNLGDPSRNPFRSIGQPNIWHPMTTSIKSPLPSMRTMRVSKIEGRLEGPSEALLYGFYSLDPKLTSNTINVTTADMCLSALYLHELHKNNSKQPHNSPRDPAPGTSAQTQTHTVINAMAAESTPLLGKIRS